MMSAVSGGRIFPICDTLTCKGKEGAFVSGHQYG